MTIRLFEELDHAVDGDWNHASTYMGLPPRCFNCGTLVPDVGWCINPGHRRLRLPARDMTTVPKCAQGQERRMNWLSCLICRHSLMVHYPPDVPDVGYNCALCETIDEIRHEFDPPLPAPDPGHRQ